MVIINESNGLNGGLGKPKWMKQIRMRNVSLKNAVKVGKFAIPIATSIIPGGGAVTKILDSKIGRSIGKIAKSKLVKKVVKLSKTKVGGMVVNHVKQGVKNRTPVAQSLSTASAKDFSEMPTVQMANDSEPLMPMDKEVIEPVGELTPVKSVETPFQKTAIPLETEPKNNTMMYIGLGVLALGGLYLATKKSE